MPALIDLTGRTFGRLNVIERVGSDSNGNAFWRCRCSCEIYTTVRSQSLLRGATKSCGCYQREKASLTPANLKHGMCSTREWTTWRGIKTRCLNKKSSDYKNYGGRGIRMCPRWRNSFQAFFEDMGTKPPGLSIDRIDNDGNYEPGNCRWATAKQQIANRRPLKKQKATV